MFLEDLNVEIIKKKIDLQNITGGMTANILVCSEYTHVRQQSANHRELLLKNVLWQNKRHSPHAKKTLYVSKVYSIYRHRGDWKEYTEKMSW
jgi:hypothetical protein